MHRMIWAVAAGFAFTGGPQQSDQAVCPFRSEVGVYRLQVRIVDKDGSDLSGLAPQDLLTSRTFRVIIPVAAPCELAVSAPLAVVADGGTSIVQGAVLDRLPERRRGLPLDNPLVVDVAGSSTQSSAPVVVWN